MTTAEPQTENSNNAINHSTIIESVTKNSLYISRDTQHQLDHTGDSSRIEERDGSFTKGQYQIDHGAGKDSEKFIR